MNRLKALLLESLPITSTVQQWPNSTQTNDLSPPKTKFASMDADTHSRVDEFTPCSACGWTADQARHCSYKSNIKLFYNVSDRAAWSLGSKFILKERSKKRVTLEPANTRLV
jgi:hypothetical protein